MCRCSHLQSKYTESSACEVSVTGGHASTAFLSRQVFRPQHPVPGTTGPEVRRRVSHSYSCPPLSASCGRQANSTIPGSVLSARKPAAQKRRPGSSSSCPEHPPTHPQPGESGRGNPESRSNMKEEEEKTAFRAVPSFTSESHFKALPILGTCTGCLFLFTKQK